MANQLGMVVLMVINYIVCATLMRGNMYDVCSDTVDYTYGSVVQTAEKIDSVMVCAIECVSRDCLSFTFDNQTKTCLLNAAVLPLVEPCTKNIKYVEKYVPSHERCIAGINDVRLCNLTENSSGRVEVFVDGQWGTVCDDLWDDLDAEVVCKMLGYESGKGRLFAYFGQGTGNILLDDVNCMGSESSIFNCPHIGISDHNCNHIEDAGVVCT